MAATARWEYSWPGVNDTIEGPGSEAKARAAIRAKHQLKWVPNNAVVRRAGQTATVVPFPTPAAAPVVEPVRFRIEQPLTGETVQTFDVAPVVAPTVESLSTAIVDAIASTSVWRPDAKSDWRPWTVKPPKTAPALKGPATLRHPAIQPARPKRDATFESFVGRLAQAKLLKVENPRVESFVGRAFGDGFYCVATDGKRALCRKGDARKATPEGADEVTLASVTDAHQQFDIADDVVLALQRMKVVAGAGSAGVVEPLVTLAIDPTRRHLHLWAQQIDVMDAHEWTAIDGPFAKGTCATFNINYLLDGLGRPSRVFYLPNQAKPIIIETADGEARYVLMPMGRIQKPTYRRSA